MASAMMTTNMDMSMEIHSRSVVCMAVGAAERRGDNAVSISYPIPQHSRSVPVATDPLQVGGLEAQKKEGALWWFK